MTAYTNLIVPVHDFSPISGIAQDELIRLIMKRAKYLIAIADYQPHCDIPCMPTSGGTPEEISALNAEVNGRLPNDYAAFLRTCRYLIISQGFEIGGLDLGRPWLSDRHCKGKEFIIFACYCRFADSDQLMIDTDSGEVIAYLHELGPLFERYAPNFLAAVWRMVTETF